MSVATRESQPEAVNAFARSLDLGFRLNQEELERATQAMRRASVTHRAEVIIPPKRITPITKGLDFEEKLRIRAEVDSVNASRTQKVEDFLGIFLPYEMAHLLASRLKPTVEGLVVIHCPSDQHFTLIVDHT